MQKTKIGFKKPEGTDVVDIRDINDNADLIDVELMKRPLATGDASDMKVKFSEAAAMTELTSGEKLSSAFGKLKPAVKNMISLVRLLGTTDISAIGGGTVTGAISAFNASINGITADGMLISPIYIGASKKGFCVASRDNPISLSYSDKNGFGIEAFVNNTKIGNIISPITEGTMDAEGRLKWFRHNHLVVLTITNVVPNTIKQISKAPLPIGFVHNAVMPTDLSQSGSIWNIGSDGYATIALGDGTKNYTGQIIYMTNE